MFRCLAFTFLLLPCLLQARDGIAVVPFEIAATGHLIVEVSVNGQQAERFLIDTAAGISLLDIASARRLGVEIRPRHARGSKIAGLGGKGHKRLRGVDIDDLELGMAVIPSPEFYATDLSQLSKLLRAGQLIGILGSDFLRDHHGVVDYASQTLTLAWY